MMFTIRAFCISSVLTLMAHSAFGALVLTGDVVEIAVPPIVPGLAEGALELGDAQIFQEKSGHSLASMVSLDDPAATILPAGTIVDSFYVHFDGTDTGTGALAIASGTITFMNPIIGLIYRDDLLDDSDAELGIPGMTYQGGRKSEVPGDTLSFVGSTLTFNLRTIDGGVDDLRVLTESSSHMPEPTSLAVWLSLGAASCLFSRRRRFSIR